jgi:hypothetical protein
METMIIIGHAIDPQVVLCDQVDHVSQRRVTQSLRATRIEGARSQGEDAGLTGGNCGILAREWTKLRIGKKRTPQTPVTRKLLQILTCNNRFPVRKIAIRLQMVSIV